MSDALDRPAPDTRALWRSLVDTGLQATAAYDRPDLGRRLERTRSRLEDPDVNVVIVGEFKQGKSSLINALLNARVCAVDDDIATAVPAMVRHGDEHRSWVLLGDPDDPAIEPERVPIDQAEVARFETEEGQDHERPVRGVEIELPRRLLSGGLVLIDTPGVGGLGSAHATAALGALSLADAVVFVSDASQEFTRAEIDFLSQARDLCPRIVTVMTKIDFYPSWRRVHEINLGHLERGGFDIPHWPVSSVLRLEAARRKDRELNTESGFGRLSSWLSDDVVAGAAAREIDQARRDLVAVCDQLGGQFRTELDSLKDPEKAAELSRSLDQARDRAQRLKGQVARWNVTLNDGVADLNSEVDFDFKARMRGVTQESDASIEDNDPLATWAEFEPWLVNRVSQEVVANYRYLVQRAHDLSVRVGEHFEEEGGALIDALGVHNPMTVLEEVGVDPSLEVEDMGAGAQGFTVLRGSYTGVLMFTMIGSMIGITLAPVAVGVGLLMGRKGLREEKERQRRQRQSQAKIAVRRYCDEVSFKITKDSRDTLRRVHRQLRDHYTNRAEELHASTSASLKAAAEAAKRSESERATRIKDLQAEIGRVDELRSRVDAAVRTTTEAAESAR